MRLFPWQRDREPEFDAPLHPETTAMVVGDIHGRADLMLQMFTKLDTLNHNDAHLIFVGDYLDRGEDSARVLSTLYQFHTGAQPGLMTCLKGNHEQMLLDFLDAPAEHGPRWLRHGGLQTLASFKLAVTASPNAERDWIGLRDAFRDALDPQIEAWLRSLPLTWQSGNLFVCHAGTNPDKPISEQSDAGLLWGHPTHYERPRKDGIWVAHGHIIVDKARPTMGRIPVDTGAYATGRLTCAIIEPGAVEFLTAVDRTQT
ncbi:MAG: metallophosphoesterase [Marinovum sp.]|nr:metallophosphoesterase [Marinovum sp.]